MGEILITRDYHELYSSQEFKIIIDGKEVNNIKNNKRKVISLPVGQHEMYIQVMGTKSLTKIVNIEPKKTLRLSCGSNLKGFKYIFHWLFAFSKNNIYLEETV